MRVIERNNNFLCSLHQFESTVMPALMIPYDTIHIMYAQGLVGHRLERAASLLYIFVNPFTSCFTDRYLPQQYITMQTIKRFALPWALNRQGA